MKNINIIIKSLFTLLFFIFYYDVIYFLIDIFDIPVDNFNGLYKIIFLFVTDIILFLSLFLMYRKDLKKEFIIFKSNFKDILPKCFRYWYYGIIVMVVSNIIIGIISNNNISNNEDAVRSIIDYYPIYGLFTVCIIAPFVEEIVFRKTFRDVIKNKYIYIITCGIIFGVVHVIGTYTSISDILYIIPYGIFGSVFAYIYYKTNTIFASMSIHLFHNTLLTIIFLITNNLL